MTQKASESLRPHFLDDQVQVILKKLTRASQAQDTLSGPSRLQITLWCGLVLASCFLFFAKYSEFQIGAYRDDASYIVLAYSIVHSDTYGLINRPDEPAETQFPFGFPLLLAPIVLLAPEKLDAFRAVALIATLTNCALLFWGWKSFSRKRSYWWALAITGLYVLSPGVVDLSRMVMSEPIFLTFCLIALLLTEQAARRLEGRSWFLWMGLALTFVLFIRTVGFTLALAVFPYLIWKRGIRFTKSLSLVLLVIVLAVGAIVLTTPVEVSDLVPTGYVEQVVSERVSQAPGWSFAYHYYRFSTHLGVFLWQLLIPLGGGESAQQTFATLGISFAPTLLNLLLLMIVALGFVAWIRQEGVSSFAAFAVVYLGIVYFWAWDGRRFLYPIEPQLQFALLLGIESILVGLGSRLPQPQFFRRSTRLYLGTVVALLLIAAAYKSTRLEPSILHMGDIYSRTTWLKANTQPADLIMTEQPEVDFVNSGRKTVGMARAYGSPEALWQDLLTQKVKYVLVAPANDWQVIYTPVYAAQVEKILPLLESLAVENSVRRVYSSEDGMTQVFRVLP